MADVGLVDAIILLAEEGVEVGVIVSLPGSVVSGTTTSAKSFLDAAAREWEKARSGGDPSGSFQSMWSGIRETSGEGRSLYLRNAHFIAGNTRAQGDGVQVEIRASQVAAIAFGRSYSMPA
jgi:hypothetical protein